MPMPKGFKTAYQRWIDGDLQVGVWEERDRLSIVVQDQEDRTIAAWWDEDAAQMFTDGFFKHGRDLARSVVKYMDYVGASAYYRKPRGRKR